MKVAQTLGGLVELVTGTLGVPVALGLSAVAVFALKAWWDF